MKRAGVLLLFVLLAVAYLWPGPIAMVERRTDTVMSDGTDPAPLPFQYDVVLDAWRTRPLSLLYGAVATTRLNAPDGFALWIPWNERWAVVLFSHILPVEQISTALVLVLLVFDALAMYAFGRRLGWSRSLSIAMAIAWSFSAYTRARAKVHMSMAGVYHLPLVFLGLILVAKGRTWKSAATAGLCFLLAMTVAHYYIITLAFLGPFLLAYLLASTSSPRDWPRASARLLAAALPAVVFLGWCMLAPVPPGALQPGATVMPRTGETLPGEIHPFLTLYAARPIDYVTGDVGLGDRDWNPIRQGLTSSVLNNLEGGNPHERANGVRWTIWALALAAVIAACHPVTKHLWAPVARRQLLVLSAFAAFAFWLSLPPDVLFPQAWPSYWLHSIVSQIRVPSRAGLNVQFGLIVMAGLFVRQVLEAPRPHASGAARSSRGSLGRIAGWLALPAVLPLIMIVELPPLAQAMPMDAVEPAYPELQGTQSGAGLYFPYISVDWQQLDYYRFLQQMRGSRLQILNALSQTPRDEWFLRTMPLHPAVLNALDRNNPALTSALLRLKSCVPLTWLVFDRRVGVPSRERLCAALGWTLSDNGVCRADTLAAPIVSRPEDCH